jgi:2Fe-2S ferredoxin
MIFSKLWVVITDWIEYILAACCYHGNRRDKQKMPKVTIDGKEIDVQRGITILDAALDNDIPLTHNCGGNGACSTCHVFVETGIENLSELPEDEADMLDTAAGRTERSRLACRAQVMGDITIGIPPMPDA